MSPRYTPMADDEIRRHLGSRRCLLTFVCRKGRLERMPKVLANARYGRREQMDRGMVMAISTDGLRVRVDTGNGCGGGWVDVADVFFHADYEL